MPVQVLLYSLGRIFRLRHQEGNPVRSSGLPGLRSRTLGSRETEVVRVVRTECQASENGYCESKATTKIVKQRVAANKPTGERKWNCYRLNVVFPPNSYVET